MVSLKPASISVVIPAYDAGPFIEETIESVVTQDHAADEIIIVNDGSTDRDYTALETLAPRITVVNQSNRGVSAARNAGCELARGEYVAILDADDVWLPGKLQAQASYLSSNPDCSAVFARALHWREPAHGSPWPRPGILPLIADSATAHRLYYRDFLCGVPVAPSTMVVKKAAWEAIGGFDETKRYAEDQDFYLRLAHDYRVDILRIFATLYRRHSASATARMEEPNHWAALISGTIDSLGYADRWGMEADPDQVRRYLANLHFIHGYEHFWRGRFDIAYREFRRATANAPLEPRYLAYLILSSAPGLRTLVRNHLEPYRGRSSARSAPVEGSWDDGRAIVEIPPQCYVRRPT